MIKVVLYNNFLVQN